MQFLRSMFTLPQITYREPIVIHNIITHEECEYIKSRALPKLRSSTVSDDMIIDDMIRRSETAWLHTDDPVIHTIVNKCLKYTNKPCENCEGIQVLRYKPRGFYTVHQDATNAHKNKRMHTFILALNDEYEGGTTYFPVLKRRYRLHKGDALFFDTLDNRGMINNKSLHTGEEVKRGEKWICNVWVRQTKYRL